MTHDSQLCKSKSCKHPMLYHASLMAGDQAACYYSETPKGKRVAKRCKCGEFQP